MCTSKYYKTIYFTTYKLCHTSKTAALRLETRQLTYSAYFELQHTPCTPCQPSTRKNRLRTNSKGPLSESTAERFVLPLNLVQTRNDRSSISVQHHHIDLIQTINQKSIICHQNHSWVEDRTQLAHHVQTISSTPMAHQHTIQLHKYK